MRYVAAIIVVLTAGCLDHTLPEASAGAAPTYIALQRDFRDFQSWSRVLVGEGVVPGGQAAGTRYVYWSGSKGTDGRFEVGSIIVKTVEVEPDPTTWELHAMAKRGGDFNRDGAVGWEWFELQVNAEGVPVIIWRGEAPPDGEGYGLTPGATASEVGDCNACHAAAPSTDSVLVGDPRVGTP